MIEATPIQCGSVASPDKVSRRVFCRHYSTCLDYAVEKDWDNFSCEACLGYERERKTSEQWSEEAGRCMMLLHFVEFSSLSLKVNTKDVNVSKNGRNTYSSRNSSATGSEWPEVHPT